MILYVSGDLFESPAQVLVNTVNTVGVMGKGVARGFRELYPDMFREYQRRCETGQLSIGTLWLYKSPHKWVLNFPTKRHWRDPSQVEYIEKGLATFCREYDRLGIHSIAFPPLGCGNGRLDFATQVQPMMHRYLASLPIEVFVYPSLADDSSAEHEHPEEMKRWLRGEPRSLPFSELWEDIIGVLSQNGDFATATKGTQYKVAVDESGEGLVIDSAGQRRRVSKEVLVGLWQQLRDHGFTMRAIVPGVDATLWYYLLPVFARLPYVTMVTLADKYDELDRSPIVGLQVLPSAFHRGIEAQQLLLFETA